MIFSEHFLYIILQHCYLFSPKSTLRCITKGHVIKRVIVYHFKINMLSIRLTNLNCHEEITKCLRLFEEEDLKRFLFSYHWFRGAS